MGEKVAATGFDLSDRQRYRRKLKQCLLGLERLLEEKRFDKPRNLMGLEIELNLTDRDGLPRMMNEEVLERIASRDFQTELAQFNIEVNIAPHRLSGRVLDRLAEELRMALGYADRKAREVGAQIVMVGILPTLGAQDLVGANLSRVDRYTLLNDRILAARGEDITLDIAACGAPDEHVRLHRARGGLHLDADAPPGHPGPLRRRMERRAGGRRAAGRPRCQLPVPVRP